MVTALREGLSREAHTRYEVDLAEAVCDRFASIERVRFTNSGTEANLMALSAARVFTGRDRVLVFRGGYHGGLLTFASGPAPANAPYDVLVAPYNDASAAQALLRQHADEVACVLVEPMLGSAGCIPGKPAFLSALREETTRIGALLVFDEVMTSRTGAGGLQTRLGIRPDLTTLGKYLGGGSSFGAFGERADVMALFDPTRPDALPQAGTFNNNLVSMAAGHAGLTRVYTPEVAERHTARGDALREQLTQAFIAAGAPPAGDRRRQPARRPCGSGSGTTPRGPARGRPAAARAALPRPARARVLHRPARLPGAEPGPQLRSAGRLRRGRADSGRAPVTPVAGGAR